MNNYTVNKYAVIQEDRGKTEVVASYRKLFTARAFASKLSLQSKCTCYVAKIEYQYVNYTTPVEKRVEDEDEEE